MKITIKNFRCHIDSVFEIEDGKVVLIKSPSGMGKSTILWAIYWCLYGSLRNIQPLSDSTAKTEVTMEFSEQGYTIYRRKKPDLLQMILGEKVYQDKAAQALIDQNFGSKEIWLATCYLAQGERSALLSATNSARTELLNSLSFSSEDPDQYISRISAELKTLTAEYTIAETRYNSEVGELERKLEKRPVNEAHFYSQAQLEKFQTELESNEVRLKELQTKLLSQRKLQGMKSSLKEELENLRRKLEGLTPISDVTIVEKETELSRLNEELRVATDASKIKSNRDSLLTSLKKLDSTLAPLDYEVTEELVWKTAQQEKEYSTFQAKLKVLNLPETITSVEIEREREKLQKEIQKLSTLEQQAVLYSAKMSLYTQMEKGNLELEKLKAEYQSLNPDQLQSVDLQRKTSLEKEIQDAYTIYLEAKKTSEVLQCPNCSVSLNYAGGKLHKLNVVKVTAEEIKILYDKWMKLTEEKKSIEKTLSDLRQLKTLTSTIEAREKSLQELLDRYNKMEIENIDEAAISLTPTEIKKKVGVLTMRLNSLSSLGGTVWPAKPVFSSDLLRSHLEVKRLRSQLDSLGPDPGKFRAPELIKKEITSITSLLKTLRSDQVRYIEYQQREEELSTKLAGITLDDSIEPEIEYLISRNRELTEKIDEGRYNREMATESERLEQEQARVLTIYEDMSALQRLHTLAVQAEYNQLEETIRNVNNLLNSVLSDLFEDPIRVTISNFKTLKSDKNRVKPNVNLVIEYKGMIMDPQQLSGGELDRLSLGILLALNQISGCPFILLDECCSSLDMNMREACLRAIEQITLQGKTAVCVEHLAVEGSYGQVISL